VKRSGVRPIVVYAIDQRSGSPSSLSRVVFFTRLYGADLHLLQMTPRAVSKRRIEERRASALVELAAAEAGQRSAVRLVERRGPTRPNIVEYVRSHGARLLVVDSQLGARHPRLPGTGVARLGRSVPCPIVVLPRSLRHERNRGPLAEILCALDHGPSTAATLATALFIARKARARLTLLHVLQGLPIPSLASAAAALRVIGQYEPLVAVERERLRRLVPARAAGDLRIQYAVRTGDARRAIAHVSEEIGAQLIVLGAVPRNVVDDILVGSTSGPILRRATVPVALVPALPGSSDGRRRRPRRMNRQHRGGAR
jgi:nucleotide-binding universal stress UspA family protein